MLKGSCWVLVSISEVKTMALNSTTIEGSRQMGPVPAPRSGLVVYFCLLTAQTIGAAIILVNGVPVYRQMVGDFANHQPHPGILWWAVVAVIIIQAAYWLRVRLQPSLHWRTHVVIGHMAFFVARLSFIFASASFTVIFFARFDQLSLPPHRILIVLAMLFSLFCYTLELERLAKALSPLESSYK